MQNCGRKTERCNDKIQKDYGVIGKTQVMQVCMDFGQELKKENSSNQSS